MTIKIDDLIKLRKLHTVYLAAIQAGNANRHLEASLYKAGLDYSPELRKANSANEDYAEKAYRDFHGELNLTLTHAEMDQIDLIIDTEWN